VPAVAWDRGRGAANLDEDTYHPAPPGIVLNTSRPAAPVQVEPSWGRVLVTTIKVWVAWRLRCVGFGQQPVYRQPGRKGLGWRLAALAGFALAVIAVAALAFTGIFARTAAPAARVPSAASPVASHARTARTHSAARVVPTAAAAWIAGQVNADAIIACDPAMCAALQAQGVTAGRLMPLPAGTADPDGATVVVTSTSAGSQLASQYAPAVIASFGSGNTRIDVRATEPGGAAAYESALKADLAARQSAGTQLLRNPRVGFTAQDATQLRAGAVDSRLLATLAALSSQYSIRVIGFGDTSPGVQVLFRDVTIMSGSRDAAAELAAVLAVLNQQHAPYLPAQATIIHPAPGQAALRIEFAAPSPLGLLTAVLAADVQPAAPRGS
jgi:hypothetical protein